MVKSTTGRNTNKQRNTRLGDAHSGSKRFTSEFLSFIPVSDLTDMAGADAAALLCQFQRQDMAYKEAKPQTFVRIIVPILVRVM
jgi:hypothetical protein